MKLYFTGLDFSNTERQMRSFFSKFGDVMSVEIARNVKGRSLGYGAVQFSNPEEALREMDSSGRVRLFGGGGMKVLDMSPQRHIVLLPRELVLMPRELAAQPSNAVMAA